MYVLRAFLVPVLVPWASTQVLNCGKAAQHGDLKKVQDYIKTYGDVNMAAKDKHGFTALHLAAHDGHLSVVKCRAQRAPLRLSVCL